MASGRGSACGPVPTLVASQFFASRTHQSAMLRQAATSQTVASVVQASTRINKNVNSQQAVA